MRLPATLFLAFLLLTFAAHLRPPEYDEAYSIFLTAGDRHPAWPQSIFHPADVQNFYQGAPTPTQIATNLRKLDVHPPLYFWTLEYWRRLFGPSWFAARLLSVLYSTLGLAALAWLATLAEIPPIPTLLIALLSYGFAYTGIIARGFALAQLLNIIGMALTLKGAKTRKPAYAFPGGLAFGAAGFTNYLAIFIGVSTIFWFWASLRAKRSNPSYPPPQDSWIPNPASPAAFTTAGLALFLPSIAWFFLAQRNSRIGQFTAFSPAHALPLLAKDSAAALFGGLPLYAGHAGAAVELMLASLIIICINFVIKNHQRNSSLFALAAIATPIGLLALGLIFNNTPIEIRYLAFSLPFIALLLAQTLPRNLLYLILCIEACGFIGLILAPATMQPQGIAARELRNIPGNPLILLPFGNDGVGIPGPFIASIAGNPRLQLIKPGPLPNLAVVQHVILVTIQIDAASRQTVATALQNFNADPCWIQKTSMEYIKVFNRTCRSH